MKRKYNINKNVFPTSLDSLCERYGITDKNRPKKWTQKEKAEALDLMLSGLLKRLEDAKAVYKKQRQQIESLQQAELWSFSKYEQAPPDYRSEYLRRIAANEPAPTSKLVMVKTPIEEG